MARYSQAFKAKAVARLLPPCLMTASSFLCMPATTAPACSNQPGSGADKPLDEPISQYGPFVMDPSAEQSLCDYPDGSLAGEPRVPATTVAGGLG